MPDLDVAIANAPKRVFELLHDARPVLINFEGAGALDGAVAPWADRVRSFVAESRSAWELPVVGEVAPPAAILICPDGHVAWVGEGSAEGLADALTFWFGPPAFGTH